MIESNHVVLWNRCLDVIKDNVPETTYNTWFAPIVPLKYCLLYTSDAADEL